MLKTAARVTALFAVYAGMGFMVAEAFDLFAQAPTRDVRSEAVAEAPEVVVEVRPEIVTRIDVRRSDRCEFELDREVTIPAQALDRLEIVAGSGELRVEGRAELVEVVAVGRVCASEESLLEELTLSAEAGPDGVATIETHYPEQRGWSGRSRTARIDLVVLVPAGLDVDIDDSSGEMVVSGTGALRIDDSSGSIDVFDIDGSVDIDDSSGGLEIRDVRGDLSIEDSSGGIDAESITGNVTLRDGSGGIDLVDIGGSVVVESDGSGGIEVERVGGDFRVVRDGSGGIRHSGVEGSVDIPENKRRGR